MLLAIYFIFLYFLMPNSLKNVIKRFRPKFDTQLIKSRYIINEHIINLQQRSRLHLFCQSTIPQNQFSIIIIKNGHFQFQMIVMRFSQQCWPFSLLVFQVTWGWRYAWDIIRRWNLQPRCHWSNDLINMVNQWVLLHARKWLFMLSAKIWTLSANVICKL